MNTIDPQEYGELRAEVRSLREAVTKMEQTVDRLVAVENQKIGALWMGRFLAGIIGAVAFWIIDKFVR